MDALPVDAKKSGTGNDPPHLTTRNHHTARIEVGLVCVDDSETRIQSNKAQRTSLCPQNFLAEMDVVFKREREKRLPPPRSRRSRHYPRSLRSRNRQLDLRGSCATHSLRADIQTGRATRQWSRELPVRAAGVGWAGDQIIVGLFALREFELDGHVFHGRMGRRSVLRRSSEHPRSVRRSNRRSEQAIEQSCVVSWMHKAADQTRTSSAAHSSRRRLRPSRSGRRTPSRRSSVGTLESGLATDIRAECNRGFHSDWAAPRIATGTDLRSRTRALRVSSRNSHPRVRRCRRRRPRDLRRSRCRKQVVRRAATNVDRVLVHAARPLWECFESGERGREVFRAGCAIHRVHRHGRSSLAQRDFRRGATSAGRSRDDSGVTRHFHPLPVGTAELDDRLFSGPRQLDHG